MSCVTRWIPAFHASPHCLRHGQPFTNDLAELGRYYRAYQRLMDHWRTVLPPGAMLEVEYQALVEDFAQQARRIVAYCGLQWHPACLEFHKASRSVRTASMVQVRQPIYRDSIRRWRPDPALLRPLVDALTHEPAATRTPRRIRSRTERALSPVEFPSMVRRDPDCVLPSQLRRPVLLRYRCQ